MSELAAFQDAFVAALRGEGRLAGFGPEATMAAGVRVYRNTSAKGAIDALRGNFPTVERLVGEDWFTDCARLYVSDSPPSEPSLLNYGADFPDFLAKFSSTAQLPYLAEVAAFDRLWTESHTASDARAFTQRNAAVVAPDILFQTGLALHPSVRIAWSEQPAPTIWRLNRPPAPLVSKHVALDWRGEGLLLVRVEGEVRSRVLDLGTYVFLDGVRSGALLGDAAAASLDAAAGFDLAAAFADLLTLGAFTAPIQTTGDKDLMQ